MPSDIKRVDQIDPDPRKLLPDDDMLSLVLDRFEASKRFVQGMHSLWERCYKLYRSYVDNRSDWPFDTNLFVPLTFSTVETFLPRLVSERPRIKVEARNDDDLPTASVHRQLLDYQWDYLGMGVKLIELVKNALIYGTAWAKVTWDQREAERTFKEVETDELGVTRTFVGTKPVTVYDDPVVNTRPIEDIYPDPSGSDIDGCNYIIDRMKMQFHQLDEAAKPKEEGGMGYSREAVNELKKIRQAKLDSELNRLESERNTAFNKSDTDQALDLANIWEFDVLDYWEDNRHAVVVLDPPVILLNEVNPFWHGRKPFIRVVDNILPGELYGMGEPEILESLQMELNDMHNLRMENVKRMVMQMFKVKRDSPISPEHVKFQPQGVIFVNEQDDIQELFTRDVKSSSYREIDAIRLWSQEATGATDPFKGMETGIGSETATGASILAQAASSRAGLKFQILTEMALRPLGELLIALNEQFIEDERIISVTGPEGMERVSITPELIARGGSSLDVRIDVGATDPVNREIERRKTTEAISIMSQVIPDPTHPVMQVLINRLLELFDISVSPEMLNTQPSPEPGAGVPGALPNNQDLVGQTAAALQQSVEGNVPQPGG